MQARLAGAGADATIFAATIRPHRSLSKPAVRLVITLVALTSIVSSIPFVVMGAWPVAGYFGLDVLLLAVAFGVNMRRARAEEQVRLTYVELFLKRVSHKGRALEWRFNPAWVKIERHDDEEFGLQRIAIVSGRTRVDLAAPLSPPERESFHDAFQAALTEAKRGPSYQ